DPAPDAEGHQYHVGDDEPALEIRRDHPTDESRRRKRFPEPAGVLLHRVGGLDENERAEGGMESRHPRTRGNSGCIALNGARCGPGECRVWQRAPAWVGSAL